jgi:small acid-soluble spore protein F (minor alpha/beta-type SASP)
MSNKKKSTVFNVPKEEIAKELGVYNEVKNNGWGEVSSRQCGNIVKKALEKSNKLENPK